MTQKTFRVDLHIHSKYSNQPSQWLLRKIGFSESYTDPFQIYGFSKKNGMDLVTITDHDSIEGALKILHLPDTFISEEVTTYFPEDGCKLHVLAINITEEQHYEIQKVKENVYDLVDYLISNDITHALAHPLYSNNNKLTIHHFEKLLLLFKVFELNGARSDLPNRALRLIFSHLTKEIIDELANKHNYYPKHPEPWKKGIIGGSDDHSGLNMNRTHTIFQGEKNVDSLIKSIRELTTDVATLPPNPRTFALNLYSIGWQYYKQKLNLDDLLDKDYLLTFIERTLQLDPKLTDGIWAKIFQVYAKVNYKRSIKSIKTNVSAIILKQAHKVVTENPLFYKIAKKESVDKLDREAIVFDFAKEMSNRMILELASSLLGGKGNNVNILHLFQALTSAGSLHTLMTPFFVSYKLFARDRVFSNKVLEHFFKDDTQIDGIPFIPCLNIAMFTDTISDINGVAINIKQKLEHAIKKKRPLKVICCDENPPKMEGIINFKPLASFKLPEYNIQNINIPPFLEMLDYCYKQEFTQIHIETPGPVGLAGLGIAKLLEIPCYATYHTAFPQYVRDLTSDPVLETAVWHYMIWFYNQMDKIFVPSKSTAEELVNQGIKSDKIILKKSGIDINRFHPSKKNGYLQKKFNLGDGINLLYVGRVSKEKNLDVLRDAFKKLSSMRNDINLIVVGDGPYLPILKEELKGTNTIFTGFLEGEELAAIYASSDIFVFPSTTDTFGNVVLEAQASGLPVIVTDQGGPKENILANVSGIIVEGKNPDALLNAILKLVDNPELRKEMGKRGREFTEKFAHDHIFNTSWEIYSDLYTPFGC